jgi:DNA-binding winged helix-turn-helix (wHTH) protein/pimeloyl-ACP methyl ester carboxylesterase
VSTVTYAFGPFRLDPAEHLLLRDGVPVTLTPKAFETLCVLVDRHGRLVPTQELIACVWPDTFVEPNNLAQQVSALRRALGDGDRGVRYIETVPRRGYRFTAPVVRHEPARLPEGVPADSRRGGDAPPAPAAPGGDPLAESGFARPRSRYALSGDTSIAYQVIGDGPIDIVFVMGWVSHLDWFWEEPSFARFLTRLASFSRLILFDKRGTGLSDRVTVLPSLEQRMDDVRAVMEAVGSTRAALLGVSEGGPMSSLFAATHPDMTLALVMIGTYAKRIHAPDYPWAPTPAQRDAFYEEIRTRWGEPIGIEDRAPSRQHDPAFRRWWASYLRNGASPGAALALTQMNTRIDVREVLPNIRVPTLILHRIGDRCLRIEEGRYVASRIPGARLIELPGDDHLPFVGNQDDIIHPVEAFLTGFHPGTAYDEVLATVLVAHVVGGVDDDTRPRLEAFVRREVAHFRGVGLEVADGRIRAAFDGPARAVRCAAAIALTARRLGVSVRAALDLGQCALTDAGVSGHAVARAGELAASLPSDMVVVSPPVHDLVAGAGLAFAHEAPTHDDRGTAMYVVDLEALLTPGHVEL